MKKLLSILCMACLCGCANIQARLVDQSGGHVEPYGCTQIAATFCTVIALPQVMSPGDFEWYAINILTVPAGLCCFVVDVPLEFVCDTVCLPYDWYVNREKDKRDH